MGSKAEMINHQNNVDTVSANMTPNSGAGKVKGEIFAPYFARNEEKIV